VKNAPPVASLKPRVIDDIVAHARATCPSECCGMLLGNAGGIEESRMARNVSGNPAVRFVIDPKDHFDAIRESRRRGLDVVGFYHSHPRTPAVPSEADLLEATYEDYLYLIVSLASDPAEIRLFRLERGAFVALSPVIRP
jgi:proteasome lid subunit RPN8/RPN11